MVVWVHQKWLPGRSAGVAGLSTLYRLNTLICSLMMYQSSLLLVAETSRWPSPSRLGSSLSLRLVVPDTVAQPPVCGSSLISSHQFNDFASMFTVRPVINVVELATPHHYMHGDAWRMVRYCGLRGAKVLLLYLGVRYKIV